MIPPSPQRPSAMAPNLPSLSAPVNLATGNDQEGTSVESAPAALPWERYLKQALAALVVGCGAALPLLSPTSDELAFKACSWVLAVGASYGIISRGVQPK